MMSRTYRYYPDEFPEPPVSVRHITLLFEVGETETRVTAETLFVNDENKLTELKLNAKSLEIQSVRYRQVYGKSGGEGLLAFSLEKTTGYHPHTEIAYTYADDLLTIRFPHPLTKGAQFLITTVTTCRPTANILEGLYYDITPDGLPPTQITQCQQWGFQRMVPCIDDMRAKCTWTTTIVADRRYTNLISNGNVLRPRTPVDEHRDSITYENDQPMPPYLFFLGVGTWDTYSRVFEYPDGKQVRLELLVLPGSDASSAAAALNILADSILWTYLFTGPERYENVETRQEVYRLCRDRDVLAAGRSEAAEPIRHQITRLNADLVNGYQYPYEVYREIAMQNSDFGGMENTGNTTIIASRIMPGPEITDASYEYMIGVKQHEFYHNLNGSGVTGDTPFSIWLNEAVTVMMEDDYLAFLFGAEYVRLQNMLQIYTPGTGTFSLDTGAAAMPIEPEGFNDPNDLITSVTYVKAPEFTRMIQTMLGKRAFAWALDLYHRRFAGGNASPRDWLHAMEDVGREDFSIMASRWLKQTGYPVVLADARYNAAEGTAEITVTQSGFGNQDPWIFPLTGRLITDKGAVVGEFQYTVDAPKMTFSVPCSGAFACCIWNERHAAYIRMQNEDSDDVLYLQLRYATDAVARFLAMQILFDREMQKLCADEGYGVSERLVSEVLRMIGDVDAMQSTGPLGLTMFEYCRDPAFSFAYTRLFAAKQKFMRAVAQKGRQRLASMTAAYAVSEKDGAAVAELARTFKARMVKNFCLTLLASLDDAEVHAMLKDQYRSAQNATDRLSALSLYLSSSAPDRREILAEEMRRAAAAGPVAWENFLAAAAGTSSPDTVAYLRLIEGSGLFHVEQAGESRSLFLRFAQNRKLSLETEEGRAFLEESLVTMAQTNEYISTGMLGVFSHLDAYAPPVRDACTGILMRLTAAVPEEKAPSVIHTARRILEGSPKAVAAFGAGADPQ